MWRRAGFADAGFGVSVGHVWLLFVLLLSARGTRRRRKRDKKKEPPRKEWLIGRSGENIQFRFLQKPELADASCISSLGSISVT